MPSHVVPIASKRITLPCGEWIEVKARLNHGEHQDLMERCYRTADDGTVHRVPFQYAEATITAYVVDWSFVGLDDQPLTIRGCPPADIQHALDLLDPDIYSEIRDAVDTHVGEVTRAATEKKRTRTTDAALSPTLA